MGPHLFRYGKNADTAREEVDTFVASMGPHLFRYGKALECVNDPEYSDASMGPHLFRYGKGGSWNPLWECLNNRFFENPRFSWWITF